MTASLEFIVVSRSTTDAVAFTASSTGSAELTTLVSVVPAESFPASVNEAVTASLADFVCVVHAEGTIAPGAVDAIAGVLADHPESTVLYGDASFGKGRAAGYLATPIYSPERLRCQYYYGDVVVYRRQFFVELGGLDRELPGAEQYDLALRASRASDAVQHVRAPLFETADEPVTRLDPVALDSTTTALETHLAATGGGEVRSVGVDGVHDTRRLVVGEPLISIVIPSRGIHSVIDGESRCYVLDAVRSIVEKSTYTNVEFVIVLDTVAEPEVIAELRLILGDRFIQVDWDKPFNFSDKVNLGVVHSHGEFVLLLNDDVQVITPTWLESLLALVQLPGAGMSGAMLYYADETIQHGGHHYYENDASHIGLDAPRGDAGPLQGYRVEREVSGVTAACAMMPKAVFEEVGGLSNLLPGNFNDVDLCMKTTWLGHSIYWTPHAELYHFESKTRDASVHHFEVDVAWGRWGFRMHDPKYWPYAHNRPPG